MVKNQAACVVINSIIDGNVTITNVGSFILRNSMVTGKVTIKGDCDEMGCDTYMLDSSINVDVFLQDYFGFAAIDANNVIGNKGIKLKNYAGSAFIYGSKVLNGDITCQGQVDATSLENSTPNGKNTCDE